MSRTPRRAVSAAVVAVILLAVAVPADAQTPVAYEPVVPTFEARPGATIFQGVDGGASYALEVPSEWDGRLVLYAHGFRSDVQPDLTVDAPPLRDAILAAGYAWAASSYSSNGYEAVEVGVDDTHELIALTEQLTGTAPTQVLITGASLGGHVTVASLERYPDSYAGAMPVCGALGDVELFEYFTDTTLAGYAEAGVEPTWPPPPALLESGELQQVAGSLSLGPFDGLTSAGFRYANVLEVLSGGERPTFEAAFSYWNNPNPPTGLPFLLNTYGGALTGGTDPRDAALVSTAGQTFGYARATTGGELLASPTSEKLNAQILRQDADPTVEPYYPIVDGAPQVPVLSLHTIGDLFVPFSMEQIYAAEAEANGVGGNVVVRAIRDVGHCAFSPQELLTAWADLLAWVNGGVRPAGDSLDPAAVRERDYGCQFTVGDTATRSLVPACPDAATSERVAGDDRYLTAVDASERAHPDGAENVLLARGDLPVDALAAAPVAGTSAPVLLSRPDALPPEVAAEIARLGASTVTLLGGHAALSPTVAEQVAAIDGVEDVDRVGGANRYETAEMLAALAPGAASGQVYLVSGEGSSDSEVADAVAVSALAAHTGAPVLLSADPLPGATSRALASRQGGLLTVVGGSAAVTPPEVSAATTEKDPERDERLSGDDRYGTSAVIVERARASGLEVNDLWIATGRTGADALTAGPAAASAGQALLLVDGLRGPTEPTTDLLAEVGAQVSSVVVAGGSAAVEADVVDAVLRVVEPPAE